MEYTLSALKEIIKPSFFTTINSDFSYYMDDIPDLTTKPNVAIIQEILGDNSKGNDCVSIVDSIQHELENFDLHGSKELAQEVIKQKWFGRFHTRNSRRWSKYEIRIDNLMKYVYDNIHTLNELHEIKDDIYHGPAVLSKTDTFYQLTITPKDFSFEMVTLKINKIKYLINNENLNPIKLESWAGEGDFAIKYYLSSDDGLHTRTFIDFLNFDKESMSTAANKKLFFNKEDLNAFLNNVSAIYSGASV